MNSNEHFQRRTFLKYDDRSYLLYLNESKVDISIPSEDPEREGHTVSGFSYQGDMSDGSTRIEANGVTDDNLRDKFIAGLIRKKYTADRVEAIILNDTDTEEHEMELNALQRYRKECKTAVDSLLSR